MILAAPLVIPFSQAVPALAGLTGLLGMAALSDKVNEYIQENPEESMKILSTIIPGVGIGEIFMKKSKDEEVEEEVSVEDIDPKDLTKEEKAKMMKELAKSGGGNMREKMKKGYEEIIQPGEDRTLVDAEERYDEGGVEDAPKPKFDYKKFFRNRRADGGAIGIEVLFEEKKPRKDFNTGGRATTQDFANALKSVSAGTTYQQQAQAKEYARNEAANELRAAIQGGGIDSFLQGAGLSNYRGIFTDTRPGTNRQGAFTGTYNVRKEQLLNDLMNKKLQPTSYAPKPRPKTYRTVSPEAQALNMSQSTYEDIIRSGADPKQYYMDYQNRIMAGNPNLLKYGQVIGGPGMMSGIAGPGMGPGATPPTQAQINQMISNNPMGYADFDALVKQYSSADPYKGLKEEIKDMVDGRDTGYMSAQDYYDVNVLGLDGKGIAEKYGLQYADGGRVGLFMGGDPLTGQALSIYDSMKAYGFSDQEIANALSARGLSELGTSNTQDTTSSQTIGYQNNSGNGDGKTTSIAPGTLKSQYQTSINNPINNAIYDFKENMTTKLSDPTTKIGKLGINTKNILGSAIGAVAGIPGLGFVLDALGSDSEFDRGAIRELNAPMQLGTYNKDRTGTGYFTQGPIQPGISSLSDTYKSGLTDGQFAGVTVDDLGRIQQTGAYNTAENVMAGYNAGFDLGGTAFDRYDKIDKTIEELEKDKVKNFAKIKSLRTRQTALTDFALANAKAQREAKQAAIDRAISRGNKAAEERARAKSISAGYGGWDESPGATGPTAAGAGMGIGGGYASDYGFLKDGGLATMFKEKR